MVSVNNLAKMDENLQPLIFLDTVTMLANRRKFYEYLNSQWQDLERKGSPLSLLICSFDFSPSINNNSRDKVLQNIAQEMKKVVKRSTDLVARYSKNEFAVILSRTDSKGAIHIGKLIREVIEEVKQNADILNHQSLTMNIGVATVVPSDKITPKSLIDVVEKAIQKSKK